MNIDQIEIILLMDRSLKGGVGGAPIWLEGDANLFAVHTGADCVRIGAISEQSQTKCDLNGGHNLKIQRGTHSAPCSFNDVIEWFGPNVTKLRLVDASVAIFESENQFEIPRIGERGFVVEAKLDLPSVAISGLNGKFTEGLLRLIASEAVAGVKQLQ
jgi:hypothetical protein